MAQADKEDKTEAPSARRLARAREEGRVAISRELQTLSVLGVAVLALVMLVPPQAERFVVRMQGLMENAARIDISGGGALTVLREAFQSCAAMAGPVLLAAAAGTIVMTMVQTGFLLRIEALMPQPGRLSPMKGLSRLFGGETAVEGLKSLLKFTAFAFAVWHALVGLFPLLLRSEGWDAATLASQMIRLTLHAALLVLAVQAAVTLIDLGWVRYKHQAELRMSRQELRDEYRESEGDPHVKGRIRKLRRQRAAKQMIDGSGEGHGGRDQPDPLCGCHGLRERQQGSAADRRKRHGRVGGTHPGRGAGQQGAGGLEPAAGTRTLCPAGGRGDPA